MNKKEERWEKEEKDNFRFYKVLKMPRKITEKSFICAKWATCILGDYCHFSEVSDFSETHLAFTWHWSSYARVGVNNSVHTSLAYNKEGLVLVHTIGPLWFNWCSTLHCSHLGTQTGNGGASPWILRWREHRKSCTDSSSFCLGVKGIMPTHIL